MIFSCQWNNAFCCGEGVMYIFCESINNTKRKKGQSTLVFRY